MNAPHLCFRGIAIAMLAASAGAHAQATINQSKINNWPHVLSEPGHYKLTGNIVVPAGMPGFRITAPNVTLDLNGFSIAGPVTCTYLNGPNCSTVPVGAATGVAVQGDGAVVRGGTVKGFAGSGIAVGGAGPKLSELTVTQNAGTGIAFNTATTTLIDRVHVTMNGGPGTVGSNGMISNSSIELNSMGTNLSGCSVIDSVIRANKGVGLFGSAILVRGTRLMNNGTNKSGIVYSGGGNLNDQTLF
jgi:hypothetical protein